LAAAEERAGGEDDTCPEQQIAVIPERVEGTTRRMTTGEHRLGVKLAARMSATGPDPHDADRSDVGSGGRRPYQRGGHMPITAVVEFPPVEGEDPREAYDRISRELNGGRPMTKRSEWGAGLLAHTHNVGEDGSALVVDVWRDQAGMDAFIGRLRPILEREGFADHMNVRVFDTTDLVIEG
jgi:hypothetical protein